MISVFIVIILIILIVLKMYYTTIRYNAMVKYRNFKIYVKKNDVYIINVLENINLYIDKTSAFFDSNIIIQELVQANKIPIKFIIFFKHILNIMHKIIIYIINKIK